MTTAYMNDCEPLLCFAQQVNGYGKKEDVLLGISTSGNSKNVLYAATVAKAKGMKVVGLTTMILAILGLAAVLVIYFLFGMPKTDYGSAASDQLKTPVVTTAATEESDSDDEPESESDTEAEEDSESEQDEE